MRDIVCGIMVWSFFMTCVSCLCAIRLGRYRRQMSHMLGELSVLQQEDTNYRLSSCCRVGRTQEVIALINEIVEKYRDEMAVLRRENCAYRQSITSISHDIRTPLTSAKGYLQMLSGDLPSDAAGMERHREYISTVERRVDDVTDLLNQLFEYARVEAGEMDFHMERVNITNLFLETISMFYDDFALKDCAPAVEVPQTPYFVLADRSALARIFENLIKNALVHGTGDFSFSLKKVSLKPDTKSGMKSNADSDESEVCLCVSNRTESIRQGDLAQIFDRFYTTDTSRTRKATGLGLAIVKQFAEHMDAEVTASLKGDIFSICITFLPIVP